MRSRQQNGRLALPDLFALAAFFKRDETLKDADKQARDREIALAHPAAEADHERLGVWLDVMRQRHGLDESEPIGDIQQGLSFFLFIVGVALGVMTIGGWWSLDKLLSTSTPSPFINIIYFWSVTAGWQLLMLGMLLVGVALGDWADSLPVLGALRRLLRWLPALIPKMAAAVVMRLRPSQQQVLGTWQAWLTQSQRYRQLSFWYPLHLSQLFAVGLNLGFVGMFLFLSVATQPIFGWQSDRFTCARLERITHVMAAPWLWLDPQGTPSLSDIRQTYHAPAKSHAHTDCLSQPAPINPGWWRFLFASICVYGLLPRLLTLGLASWQVRRVVSQAALRHPDSQELLMRMKRPIVHLGEDVPAPVATPLSILAVPEPEAQSVTTAPGVVLKWAGVQLPESEIETFIQHQWGMHTLALHEVGGLDIASDTAALEAVAKQDDMSQVILLVEAWQPPVADYQDFVMQLRQVLGDGMMIWVLLYHRDQHGHIAAPRQSDLEQWRQTLEQIDAWLRVKPMLEEPAG